MPRPAGVPAFERFFRSVASIQIDKSDVRRFRDFVDEQIDDIAIAGRNSAKWNGRDVIAPQDLPITKWLIDPQLANPATEHWERAFEMFRLVF